MPVSISFAASGGMHWVDVTYISDTRAKAKSDLSSVVVNIYALYLEF